VQPEQAHRFPSAAARRNRAHSGTVLSLLAERVQHTPDAVAFRTRSHAGPWRTTPWREVARVAGRVRGGLQRAGIDRGSHVALVAHSSERWELAHFGALASAATVVGLDPRTPGWQLDAIAQQLRFDAVFVEDRRTWARLPEPMRRHARLVVLLGDEADIPEMASQHPWSAWVESQPDAPMVGPRAPGPDDVATVVFTSGTSGAPKGIPYRHGQLTRACQAGHTFLPLHGGDRTVCWMPLSHLFQRMLDLYAMQVGAEIFVVEDPRELITRLPEISPHLLVGVPQFFEALASTVEAHPELASSLGYLLSGSAPLSERTHDRLGRHGVRVFEAYGLSENVVPVAVNHPGAVRKGTVGRAVAGSEVRVAPDGELLVRGPGVCRQYLDGSEPRRTEDGFLRTGDEATMDSEGFLRIVGRKSETFKLANGRLVVPERVEQALEGISYVTRAVITGRGRQAPLAVLFVNATGPGQVDPRQVASDLREASKAFKGYERPAGCLIIDRTPASEQGEVTPNGKIRRRAIAERMAGPLEELAQRTGARRLTDPQVLFVPR
jgi:long-chain acyl-CoA synthetase